MPTLNIYRYVQLGNLNTKAFFVIFLRFTITVFNLVRK